MRNQRILQIFRRWMRRPTPLPKLKTPDKVDLVAAVLAVLLATIVLGVVDVVSPFFKSLAALNMALLIVRTIALVGFAWGLLGLIESFVQSVWIQERVDARLKDLLKDARSASSAGAIALSFVVTLSVVVSPNFIFPGTEPRDLKDLKHKVDELSAITATQSTEIARLARGLGDLEVWKAKVVVPFEKNFVPQSQYERDQKEQQNKNQAFEGRLGHAESALHQEATLRLQMLESERH